jgi:para-nitrobenzyl esterase
MERPRLETRSGVVEGQLDWGQLDRVRERAVRVFRGIPYAAPPVGVRRWAAPEPEAPWTGVRDATRFGPTAPQRPSVLMRMLGMDGVASDEDCLTLNVWTPAAGEDGGRRPVLVWLHGGGFTSGSGSMSVFDGAALARRGDAVVVTLNYRLGALGFLWLPELLAAGEPGANFGLLDQIAALEWVRAHARRLGADPDNVTLFGESAGAMSIGALLGAPRARGLFHRAILQSGAVDALLDAQRHVVDESWRGIDGLAFQPVAEGADAPGAVLPRMSLEAVAAGDAHEVSLLVGTNLDEWRLFAMPDTKLAALDEAGLRRRLLRAPPRGATDPVAFADRLLAHYRAARPDATPRELWLAMQGDRTFRMPAVRLLEAQRPHQPRCFAYLFTWESPAFDGALGSCHALEVPFVFGSLRDPRAARLVGDGPAARRLAERMQDAWLAFARDGDPGWPAYDLAKRATLLLGRECLLESDPLGTERRAWDGL